MPNRKQRVRGNHSHAGCVADDLKRDKALLRAVVEYCGGKFVRNHSSCRCLFHDDTQPSAGIFQADDGACRYKCHAGCNWNAGSDHGSVIDIAIAHTSAPCRDFKSAVEWLATNFSVDRCKIPVGKGSGHPMIQSGVASDSTPSPRPLEAIAKRLQATNFVYHDAIRNPVVAYLKSVNGKSAQYRFAGGGWVPGGIEKPPLYRLPDLLRRTGLICVAEGEKDADTLRAYGFTATTNIGGACAAGKTDWSPVAGREIVHFRDLDTAGQRHRDDVGRIITSLKPPCPYRVTQFENEESRPAKFDITDQVEVWKEQGLNESAIRAKIDELIKAATPWRPPKGDCHFMDARSSASRRPKYYSLAEVEPERVRWLLENCIPFGKLTTLFGTGSVGKSLITHDLAARLSVGATLPGNREQATPFGSTVFISAEDDPKDTILPRVLAAGGERKNIYVYEGVDIVYENGERRVDVFHITRQMPDIQQMVEEIGNVRLLVIDPVTAYMEGQTGNNNVEVQSALLPLRKLAEETGIAIVLITHTNKRDTLNVMDKCAGSVAFGNVARSAGLVIDDATEPDAKRRFVYFAKSNLAARGTVLAYTTRAASIEYEGQAIETVVLDWEDPPDEFDAKDHLQAKRKRATPVRDSATGFLKGLLAGGPRPRYLVDDVVKQQGLKWRTVERAAIDMGIVKQKAKGADGITCSFWALPPSEASVDQGPCSQNERAPARLSSPERFPLPVPTEKLSGGSSDARRDCNQNGKGNATTK